MSFDIPTTATTKFRTRYFRKSDERPKNTLVTAQIGDKIYFGIARCNIDVDNTTKKVGRFIAFHRMQSILDIDLSGRFQNLNGKALFHIDENDLCGVVDISKIKDLLKYFEDIDSIQKKECQPKF